MDKRKFIKKYREKLKNNLNREEALKDIDSFFELLKTTLEKNEKVKFYKIGTFSVINKKDRVISNPSTRERMKIKGRNAVKFKVAPNFIEKIEENRKNERK